MRVFKKILLWIAVSMLTMWSLIFIPSFSSFVALAVIGLILPIDAWQEILKRIVKGKIKNIIAIVLAVVTVFTVPGIYEDSPNNDIEVAVSTTSTLSTIENSTTKEAETTTKLTTTTSIESVTTTTSATTTTTTKKITTTNTKKITTTTKATTKATQGHMKYVLNTESMKFHHITCGRLPTKNREDTTMSRDEIIDLGYEPCGFCKP